MAKSKTSRKQVRPIEQASISDKRFKQIANATKRVSLRNVHALVVCADLRKGVLTSLAQYLKQQKGIPDRTVALELRKLVSGSASRTAYRLMVVEHPDGPRNNGGRPPGKNEKTLSRHRHIVARYEQFLAIERKAHLAREAVAKELKCDEATVKRALRSVRDARKRERTEAQQAAAKLHRMTETGRRREAALDALRKATKKR